MSFFEVCAVMCTDTIFTATSKHNSYLYESRVASCDASRKRKIKGNRQFIKKKLYSNFVCAPAHVWTWFVRSFHYLIIFFIYRWNSSAGQITIVCYVRVCMCVVCACVVSRSCWRWLTTKKNEVWCRVDRSHTWISEKGKLIFIPVCFEWIEFANRDIQNFFFDP